MNSCPACGTECAIDEPCPSCRQRAATERVGTTLANRYLLEDVIGRGGFGVVYRAKQLGLGSTVAVKFLLAEWAKLPEMRARFEREAGALVHLNHPGIVTALDFGEDAGDLYLVMEWLRGESLANYIGKELPEPRLVDIIDQVLQVLEVAHAQGIVHRDLKPENIMLVADRVKVLDFGLVLVTDPGSGKRLTASNAVNGTCYYMSPEQCRGRDVGPPADIYAIGCILHELISGEPPFMGETAVDVMMRQLVLEPPLLTAPPGMQAIVRACLAKNAKDRPTASALRSELRAYLQGTDAVTRANDATRARVAAASMPRDDRAIGAGAADYQRTEANLAPVSARPDDHPLVMMWGFDRNDPIRASLALQGIRAVDWTGVGIPMADGMRAIVLRGDERAGARTSAVRAAPNTAKVPILITDVASEQTPALIRAGASDVVLAGGGDDVIAQRVWRLIRRKR